MNGGAYSVDAPVGTSLAQALREELGFTGTKIACNEGHCGACTVLVDGVPTLSCITLVHSLDGGEEIGRIRDLLETARDLWRVLPEVEEGERSTVGRMAFSLLHLADILAVTTVA